MGWAMWKPEYLDILYWVIFVPVVLVVLYWLHSTGKYRFSKYCRHIRYCTRCGQRQEKCHSQENGIHWRAAGIIKKQDCRCHNDTIGKPITNFEP